jgi:hypothetical protein
VVIKGAIRRFCTTQDSIELEVDDTNSFKFFSPEFQEKFGGTPAILARAPLLSMLRIPSLGGISFSLRSHDAQWYPLTRNVSNL